MNIKKNLVNILILIITMSFICSHNVFAATKIVDRKLIIIDGQYVHKLYDNPETGTTDYYSDSVAGKIIINEDGVEKVGFCVDFGINISTGTADSHTLKEYFSHVIGEEATEKLIKKLTEYIRFGYGTEGKTSDKYYLATQKLIWEAISDTGFYASDYYVKEAAGAVRKIRLANFRWTINNGNTVINLDEEINSIKTSIDNYYKKPSFCSSKEKLEIEVGETAEYSDNNNVLSQFEITCDSGIECNKDGNKLKVTAVNEAGTNNIRFEKNDTKGSNSYIYKAGSGQGVLAESGTLEPISCEFGIDSFKNEKTADLKILYVITIGLFCGIMTYITYYTKKSLDGLK